MGVPRVVFFFSEWVGALVGHTRSGYFIMGKREMIFKIYLFWPNSFRGPGFGEKPAYSTYLPYPAMCACCSYFHPPSQCQKSNVN